MRYQDDMVMRVPSVLLIAIMPVLLLMLLIILCSTDTSYNRLNDYVTVWVPLMFILEFFILSMITCMMYNRLKDHSNRDEGWRWALIQYASLKGANTHKLISIHQNIISKEQFKASKAPFVTMVAMFCFVVLSTLILIPEIALNGLESQNPLAASIAELVSKLIGSTNSVNIVYGTTLIAIFIFLTMFLIVSGKVLGFPYVHDSNQVKFTTELSVSLKRVGVNVPPMMGLISHRSFMFHIVLIVFTLGIYAIYIMIWAFRGMNNHLMNQWMYEAEMLKFIKYNGKRGFSDNDPNVISYGTLNGKAFSRFELRKLTGEIKKKARSDNRMPRKLIIAEFFVMVICATYCLSAVALECQITHSYDSYRLSIDNLINITISAWISIGMFILNMFLLWGSINSLLCIASRRPNSWRQVTRSCVTFVVPLWVSALILKSNSLGSMFDFNPFVTTGVLYNVLLMMILSESIRKYYTPVITTMPRLSIWFKYIFKGRLEERA